MVLRDNEMFRIDAEHNKYNIFRDKLTELIEIVDENQDWMNWEDRLGDLEHKILYLIKNRKKDSRLYIKERVIDYGEYYE
jgi:hypothetical protein